MDTSMDGGAARSVPGDRRVKTVLVDDHPLFRLGLRTAIGAQLEIIGEVGTALDALELVQHTRLDLAIVDILLPRTSGVALTAALKRLHPGCKVLGLSMLDEPIRIAELLRAGATGYALKTQTPAEITRAVQLVLEGTPYLPPNVASDEIYAMVRSEDAWPLRRLTQREREIFDLLVAGHSNDAIAGQLFIAKRTVETHRQHIMKKVGARSLVELIRLGMKHGVVPIHAS